MKEEVPVYERLLDNPDFLLFAPPNVNLVDVWRLEALTSDLSCSSSSSFVSGEEDVEPETTRRDDHFNFVEDDYFDPLSHSENHAFQGLSPFSPISPIEIEKRRTGQGENEEGRVEEKGSCTLRFSDDRESNNSSPSLSQLVSSSSATSISSETNMSEKMNILERSVSFTEETLSEAYTPVKSQEADKSLVDSFLDISSVSICLAEKCRVSYENMNKSPSIGSRKYNKPEWNLPLQMIKQEVDHKPFRAQQQTLCATNCTSHNKVNVSRKSSNEDIGESGRKVANKIDWLESTQNREQLSSLILSYYDLQTYKNISDILLQRSFASYCLTVKARKLQAEHPFIAGGILIITSKKDVSYWDSLINCDCSCSTFLSEAKYHCYTDVLSKRRKFGAHRVASHDVVVTTFDILRAKEVALPWSDDDSSVDDDSDIRRSDMEIKWLGKRKTGDGSAEMSNLHLIHWDRIIIDHRNIGNLRCGTVRGDAIMGLRANSRISIVEQESPQTSLTMNTLQSLCNFLEIKGSLLPNAYLKVD